MDTVVARRLRPHERRKLQRLKRQLSNAVNSRRSRIILLSRGGPCNREIAQAVGLSPQWRFWGPLSVSQRSPSTWLRIGYKRNDDLRHVAIGTNHRGRVRWSMRSAADACTHAATP